MYRLGIAVLALIVSGSSVHAADAFKLKPPTEAPANLTGTKGNNDSSENASKADGTGSSQGESNQVFSRASGILTTLDGDAQAIDQTLNDLYQKYAPEKTGSAAGGSPAGGATTGGATAGGATTLTGATTNADNFLSALLSLSETAAGPLLDIIESHDKKAAPAVTKFANREGKVEGKISSESDKFMAEAGSIASDIGPLLNIVGLFLGPIAEAQSGTRGGNTPSQEDWKEYIQKNPQEAMVVLRGFQKLRSRKNAQNEAWTKEESDIKAEIQNNVQILNLQKESNSLATQAEATAKRQAEIKAKLEQLNPAADKPASDKPASDKPAADKPAADEPAAAKAQ